MNHNDQLKEDEIVDTYKTMSEQAETRGGLLDHHLRFYTRYLFGIVPIIKKNLSDTAPTQSLKGISRWTNIKLRTLFFLRAVLRSPYLFSPLVKKQAAILLQQVSANNPPAKAKPLPTWDLEKDGDADAFYEQWILKPHPVVLKGFNSKAQSWTIQNLIDRYGQTEVLFTSKDYKNYHAPLSHLFENKESVIHNCASLFVKNPEMISELDLKSFEPYMRARGPVGQLFIADKKGSGTRMHCAGNFNIFFQLEGKKRWWFFDPNHMMLLYPFPTDNNAYQISLLGLPSEEDHSNDFPLFKYCPRYTVELEPGDVLLNPPWWYHAVENTTERTLAVASRWSPPDMTETNRLFAMLQTEPQFILYILRQVLATKKRGERPNSWMILEKTAHDDAFSKAISSKGRASWGIN